MSAQPVEVDDFGLPIRPFPSPKIDAPANDSAEDKKKEDVIDSGKATPKDAVADSKDAQPAPKDDESDKFEDAPSQQPESGAASPPKPSLSPQPTASKVPDAVKEPQAANQDDDDAKVDAAATNKSTKEVERETVKDEKPKDTPVAETKASTDEPEVLDHSEQHVDPQKKPEAPSQPTQRTGRSNTETSHHEGVSEFSHQQVVTKEEPEDENKDEGWQEMPAYARYDMYDDDDRLIAKEFDPEEEEKYAYGGLGGAGKGYTRIVDDDAESATSMDDNTQYLFKQTNGTSMVEDDEDARDAMSQMQATKDLLTEGQRIAYVGIVRLEIVKMVAEAEAMELTKKTKKATTMAAEAMKMWGQKMMIRLYAHMDISSAEQVMIEQLAEHGVLPADLTPALNMNSRVHNPMADDGKSSGRASLSNPASPNPSEEKPAESPPPYEQVDGEELTDVKTPSQLPTTEKIDIDLRWTILCDLFLILIADSVYDARSRVLLERVGQSIEITWIDICRFEKKVTDALEMQQAAEKENWNEDEHIESRRKAALKRRYVMMGLATVGGGLVIGLSAGLLAPVIGAGLATGFTAIGVSGTSSFLGGVGGAALITSASASAGSVIGGKAANRRTGPVKTFEYRPLHNNKRVNLIVTVSGWLTGKVDDVRLPFSTVDPIMGDLYSIHWEPEMLRTMGETINILATEALTQTIQQILGTTILAGLMSALQLPIVLSKLAYLIDNPWAVSLDRATAAGKILADSLLDRNLGTRPITLVGYSIGARVIFSCLLELAKKGAFGIVQNVYLFGAPIVVKEDEFLLIRSVVSGRFVNAFNRNDWILGYLFRLTNGGIRRVAGLVSVDEFPWVESVDVSDIVVGHMDYRARMPALLMRCGWSIESEEFAEIEDPDPDNHQERQRELINEIEEARKELEKEGNAKKGGMFSIFGRRKKLEKEDWEIYDESTGKAKGEKGDGSAQNTGVLFDVDAIKAEMAKDGIRNGEAEEIQVREIKSTLPPMKLDISSPPSPMTPGSNPRSSMRGASRSETNLGRVSNEDWKSREPSPSYTRSGPPPAYGMGHEDESEVQMTFDTSFHDTRPVVPPKDNTPPPTRPELTTSHTAPNATFANPWGGGDEDEDDFGKEKEISMTFA